MARSRLVQGMSAQTMMSPIECLLIGICRAIAGRYLPAKRAKQRRRGYEPSRSSVTGRRECLMPSALIAKELVASLPAKLGLLAEVAAAVRGQGVNIKAVSAYERDGEGKFLLVTDDNAKAAEALKSMGATPREKSVVLVEMEDR